MQKQQTIDKFFTRDSRALSPPRVPFQCRIGILGLRRDLDAKDMTDILDLVIEDIPLSAIQSLIVPSEGDSSIYAEAWATKKKIPVIVHSADWRRDGKRAQIFRDNRIIHDATHFLIFGGPRSERPLKIATQLTNKGHNVYYMAHNSMDLQQLELPS
jgi:hypothetical protein